MIVNLIILALVTSPIWAALLFGSNEWEKRDHARERCGSDCTVCHRLYGNGRWSG